MAKSASAGQEKYARRHRLLAAGRESLNNGWRATMNHEKVLIVEDEENERTGLAELITGWGYRAETAKDGAEGLEKVTSWAPSIVVTDMKICLLYTSDAADERSSVDLG